MNQAKYWGLMVALVAILTSCQSFVEPGQTRAQMDESGATKWVAYEYDYGESHFVWIPTWVEGLLHLSTPKASNCKRMTVLRFQGGQLAGFEDLGSDRQRWAEMLKAHNRLKQQGEQGMDPLYLAVSERIVNAGAPLECVFFASGFPKAGFDKNPRVFRTALEIKREDDVLWYTASKFGAGLEVVIQDGRVVETRPGPHLIRGWQNLITDLPQQ